MSSELFRKYIDIVNENSQEPVQLDEGLLDTIKSKVAQLASKVFSPQDMEAMKQAVEQATGKPIEQVGLRDLGEKLLLPLHLHWVPKRPQGPLLTKPSLMNCLV